MQLQEPFLRLPLLFDADALAHEIAALPPQAWTEHPQGYRGNDAVRLATVRGALTDDIGTPMAPTAYLRACPRIVAVMDAIGAVWGRCRLMRLEPGAEVPIHVDANFYWRSHVRIHVPIVTNPDVAFTCGDRTVNMAAGECWVFDTFARHSVANRSAHARTHLVMDTVGGEGLWDLAIAARAGQPPRPVPPPRATPALAFEEAEGSPVMSPSELRQHIDFFHGRTPAGADRDAAFARLDRLHAGWRGAWARFGDRPEGLPAYGRLIATLGADLNRLNGAHTLRLVNEMPFPELVNYLVEALIDRRRVQAPAAGRSQSPRVAAR